MACRAMEVTEFIANFKAAQQKTDFQRGLTMTQALRQACDQDKPLAARLAAIHQFQ
jgi:hypothetical protein